MLPHQKGKELETAVAAIENIIFRFTPALKESKIKFIQNKLVIIDGARREIDLYVEIDAGRDYRSIFLFECKNWKKPVGNSEIILFNNKVEKINAQKGFFIAKKLTRDATAQVEHLPRIQFVKFTDEIDLGQFPSFVFQYISKHKDFSCQFMFSKKDINKIHLDDEKSIITHERYQKRIKDFIREYAGKTIDSSQNRKKNNLPEGEHHLSVTREFAIDDLYVDNIRVKRFFIKVDYIVTKKFLAVESQYNVENRGRVYNFEKLPTMDELDINMSFVTVAINKL